MLRPEPLIERARIDEAISIFPRTFRLRGHPGRVFEISRGASYLNDAGQVMLYVYVQDGSGWQAFAKGTVAELMAAVLFE